MDVIKYQKGIIALDLRFALNDPDAVKGSKNWEQLGHLEADKIVSDDIDPRLHFIMAKRAIAVLKGFIRGLTEYTDEHFDKSDKGFMGVTLQWANTIGGGTQYKKNSNYQEWLEDLAPYKEELEKLIRQATERSRQKGIENNEKWEESWFNPITGVEVVITTEDAVPQTGRSGFKYSI